MKIKCCIFLKHFNYFFVVSSVFPICSQQKHRLFLTGTLMRARKIREKQEYSKHEGMTTEEKWTAGNQFSELLLLGRSTSLSSSKEAVCQKEKEGARGGRG